MKETAEEESVRSELETRDEGDEVRDELRS